MGESPFVSALAAGTAIANSQHANDPRSVPMPSATAPPSAVAPTAVFQQPPQAQTMMPTVVPLSKVDNKARSQFMPTCPMLYSVITNEKMLFSTGIQEPPPVMDGLDGYKELGYSSPPPEPPTLPALVPLPLVGELSLQVECQISTCFATVEGFWNLNCVRPGARSDVLLCVPMSHQGTVTSVEINMGNGRMYATLVVPKDEAAGYGAKGSTNVLPDDQEAYNPELFRLTIPQVDAGSELHIKVTWFQPMLFNQGLYGVHIPFTIPMVALPNFGQGVDINRLLRISCTVNTGTPKQVSTGTFNHPMTELSSTPGQLVLSADPNLPWPNTDFICSYQVWDEGILTSLIVQPPQEKETDPRGTFCLSVSPPDPKNVQAFARAVVFILDRSGSMDGFPMLDAQSAIIQGLQLLRAEDRFTIIGFDHEQMAFSAQMECATAECVAAASEWVRNVCRARGTTDILTPLQQAFQILGGVEGAVPYIFLVTDGAVNNEREICRIMQQEITNRGPAAPRISTFGIGHYCNYFFLKMLANIGRGLTDVAFTAGKIREQMERMLVAASTPLLTNLALAIDGLQSCEVYPYPIPDLFCGNPLVISGKFAGQFPPKIAVVGTLPDGSLWRSEVPTGNAPQIPLHKVFVKQQLDLLTAQAWLQEDNKIKKKVVEISVAQGVPCEHTAMVGFETTPAKYKKLLSEKEKGSKINIKKYATTKYAAIAVVGGLAIGFGSVAATVGNLGPLGDAFSAVGDLAGGAGDMLSNLVCCDCGALCSECGGCWGDIGGCLGGCFGFLGDCCVGCVDNLGDGCCCILECCGSCCENCGGDVLQCIGGLLGALCG